MSDNQYIVVNKSHPRISEVLNDCKLNLCVPTYKNESLASILKKICDRIGSGGDGSEVDPVFTSSVAFNITQEDIDNWNLGGYSDEQAQDAVGDILTNSSSILFSYNDSGPSITAAVPPSFVRGLLSAISPISYSSLTGEISTSMSTNRLIGRTTVGTGVMEEIVVGSGLTLLANTLSATGDPTPGSGFYIQNQFSGPQTSANWWVSGHARVNDYLQIHNSGRIVSDVGNTMSITSSTSSTLGANLRLRRLNFFADITGSFDSPTAVYINSTEGGMLGLNAITQVNLNSPVLAFTSLPLPTSTEPQITLGSAHPLKIRGNDSLVNNVDYVDIWNLNLPGGGDTNNKAYIAYSLQRNNGSPLDPVTNRGTKQLFGRIGFSKVNDSSSLYQGDFTVETVDATINTGLPVEYFRVKYDGRLIVQTIPHEGSDVDRFLVWNPTTKTINYRTGAEIASDIGGGGGGGLTSVGLTSTDLTVTGSPLIANGNITANIANDAVTFAKMQNISAASRLMGRGDTGSGDPQEITIGSGLQIVGTTLSATVGGGTPTLQQVLTSGSTLTGANTVNAGGFNFTLNNNAIITLGTSAAQVILDASGQDITLTSTDKAFLKLAAFGSATPGDVLSLVSTTTGEVAWVANGVGSGGSVTSFSAGNLAPLFTSNVATATSTPALTFSLTNAGAHTYFGNNTGSTAAPAYKSNAALTKVDDTNITLTLGGAPATSLLEATSLTLGWTGELAIVRGGTGLNTLGTALQQLRVNSGATALEYFTPSVISSLNALTAATQTFAVGSSGGDFNIVSSTSTHTFNIPTAGIAVARGLVTNTTQGFDGYKSYELGMIINNSGANSDTRIAGDTISNLTFWDASADKIGINTNTPVSLLHITKGTNTFSGSDEPLVFVDAGVSNRVGMEVKSSADIGGIIVSNTGPSNVVFLQMFNEGNDKAWTHTLNVDGSYSLREGDTLGGIARISIAPSSGVITLLGNIALTNKISTYNNTAITDGQILIGHTGNGTFEKATLTGTVNQVTITNGAGTSTLSLPQNIHTLATPRFERMGLGAAALSNTVLNIAAATTSVGLSVTSTISPTANSDAYGMYSSPTFVENSTGTHPLFASMRLDGPAVTAGAATVTRTAALYINGTSAAVVTDANYALYIAGGSTRTAGDIFQTNTSVYTTGGYDVLTRNVTTGRYETIQADVLVLNGQVGTTYTLVLGDRGQLVKMNNASANTLTIPTNASVAFPIGTQIVVYQEGAGQTTLSPAGGVTLSSRGSAFKLAGQNAVATLIKLAANTWVASGDLTV